MVSRQEIELPSQVDASVNAVDQAVESPINDHPAIYVPDVSFLLDGQFEKVGFDLVITNPEGETFVVADYFAFIPPPNLMLPSGVGFSPEMVIAKLHLGYGEDVAFAGPATSANALVEVGKATLVIGKVTVKRVGADGQIEEVELSKGDKLYKGDEISTGTGSFVKARMIDGTRFHLGKNANAILQEYAFDETAKTGNFEAFVYRGGFHYKSGKIGKMFAGLNKSHSTISTPSAFIGIRGSELDGNVDEDGTTTIVHRFGYFEVTDINGQNEVILDAPGNTSIITFTGIPAKYEAPSEQHLETLNQNLPPPDTPEEIAQDDLEAGDAPEGPITEEVRPDLQREDEPPPEEEPASDETTDEATGPETDEGEGDGLSDEERQARAQEKRAEEREARENAEAEEGGQGEDGPGEGGRVTGQTEAEAQATQRQQTTAQQQKNQAQQQAGKSSVQQVPDNSPEGVTIRESAFADARTNVVGGAEEVVTGTGDEGTSGSTTGGTQAGAGSEGETQNVPVKATTDTNTDQKSEELPPDNPPIARNDFLLVQESGPQNITELLLGNDSDGDVGQSPRIAQIVSEGSLGGRIEFSGGVAVYQPNESALKNLRGNETATETFTYRVVSGDLTDTATLTVRLVGTNFAPVAQNDQAEALEDSPITLNVLENDSDPDGDALFIQSVDQNAARGTVVITSDGKGLLYSPPDGLKAGEVGEDIFSYKVSDGQFTTTATITIKVTGKNDPPVIKTGGEPFEISTGNGATVIPLSEIFSDADLGDELTVVSIDTTGTVGKVTIGSIIYDHNGAYRSLAKGETAFDSFGVTAVDQFGDQGSGSYTVKIVGTNDAPEPVDDSYTVLSGQTFATSAATGGVLANDVDVDNGAVLRVNPVPVSGPAHGTLTLLPNGQFTYEADGTFTGIDQFVYQVLDEHNAPGLATVTLNVTGSNEPPVTAPDTFTVSLNGTVTGNVLNNDVDPEGSALTAAIGSAAAPTTFDLAADGGFSYTAGPDSVGPITIPYFAIDALGAQTAGFITINVVTENQPPDVLPIGDQMIPAGQITSVNLANFFIDPEASDLVFNFTSPAGFITLTGSVLSAAPPLVAQGESFDVVVGASDGENTVTQTVTLSIVSPNLPPDVIGTVSNQNIFINTPVNFDVASKFDDPDGDPLTYFLITNAPFLSLSPDTNILSGSPISGQEGVYSVTIGADDGLATATTTFNVLVSAPPVNAAAVVIGGTDQHTDTNVSTLASTGSTLLVGDAEGLATSPFSINAQGVNGTATIDPTSGAFIYTPTVNTFIGFDTFTVDVVDAVGVATTVPVNILIRPPDTPEGVDGGSTGTGTEDLTISNTLSVIPMDPGPLTFAVALQPTNGSATIDPSSGNWIYTPDPEFAGADSFTVNLTDGYNYVQGQTITVNVTPVNDQLPVVPGDSFTVPEGGGASQSDLVSGNADLLVAVTDADLPGDTLTIKNTGSFATTNGSVTLNANGTFSYTHDDSETLSDSFQYQVFDGANTVTNTVTITVTPVNDNTPVADNESFSVAQGGTATQGNLDVGITLLDGDTDADGDALNAVPQVSQPTINGVVTVNPDGTFSYTHDGSANLTDSFTYQVSDGVNVGTGTVTVTVSVTPNSPATGNVLITGDTTFGNVLTADPSGIADSDGLGVFSFEWFVNGGSVAGPSTASSTYTTTISDVGKEVRVDVTYTDLGGHPELVSESVFATPQDPNVSGTQNYNTVPSFAEFVLGSPGDDTITLIGSVEPGDFIDLDDGNDTLILDNFSNILDVEGVETIIGGTSTDNIFLYGELGTLNGIISNSFATDLDSVSNLGQIILSDETAISGGGSFDNSSFGYLELGGPAGSDVTFETFSSNLGTVVLDAGTGTTSLTINTGNLVNQGSFVSQDTVGGRPPNEFSGNFVNGAAGSLIALHDLTFVPGSTLDARDGSIFVDASTILRVDGGTLLVDSDTPIIGDSASIVLLDGASTLSITGSYNIDGNSPVHDFAGAVNVIGGILNIGPGATLELTGDDIDSNVINAGEIVVKSGNTSLDGGFTQSPGGELVIDSNSISGAAGIVDTSGFINNGGHIILDNSDGSGFASALSGGTLSNASGGVIEILDGDNSLGATPHVIDASLNNSGFVLIDANLSLQGVSANHSNNGQLALLGGSTLFITNAISFTNQASQRISGDGTIDSNVVILNDGIIEPEGPGPTTLTFNGGLTVSASGVLDIDIFGGSQDQVVVSGGLTLVAGNTLVIEFQPGHPFANGGTVEDVIDHGGSLTGTITNVQHNLGPAFGTPSVVNDGVNIDLVFTPSFDFEYLTASGDWLTPTNWSPSGPPGSLDDVRIGFLTASTVDHSSTLTNTINSLTIQSGSSLAIKDGALALNAGSNVFSGATLTLNTGAAGPGDLIVNDFLNVAGTFEWNNGSITGDGADTVQVSGMLDLFIGNTTTLGVDLRLSQGATGQIDAVADTLAGTGQIFNEGFLTILRTPTLDVPVFNDFSGQLTIQGNAASASVDISQNLTNDGVLILDSFTPTRSATLELVTSTLFNNSGAVIRFQDTGAGNAGVTINSGDFDVFQNQGKIDVQTDATIILTNSTLDTRGGTIDVVAGATLTLAGGAPGSNIQIDNGTFIIGSGTISFTGNTSIDIDGPTLLDSSAMLDLVSASVVNVTGTGPLHISPGTVFEIESGDSITLDDADGGTEDLVNFGTLKLSGNGVSVNSTFYNAPGATLDMTGGGVSFKVFENSFINDGTIVLRQSGVTPNRLEVNDGGGVGTLTNYGTFESAHVTSDPTGNIFRGILINHDLLDIQHSLELNENSGPVVHQNYGSIDIAPGQTLTLGTDDDLNNIYDPDMGFFGAIKGGGTLDVDATGVNFKNAGLIMPGGFSATDILTIVANAGTEFTNESVIEIELNGNTPGTGHDQLMITGTTPALNGRLKISALSAPSGSYNIITTTGLGLIFSLIDGTDLYASDGVVLDVTKGATDLTLTAVTPTVIGTLGDDGALAATGGTDVIHGRDGNDGITGVSTGDVVFGGEGNDAISTDINFKRIDGGEGVDLVSFTSPTIDFTAIEGYRLENIEVLGFEGNGAQLVTLDAASIRGISDEENDLTFEEGSLLVFGDSADHLILIGDYNPVGTDVFDVRSPGNFEEFIRLEQNSTMTGTTSVYIDDQMLVEVQRTDSSKEFFGSAGDDTIDTVSAVQSTVNDDVIDGREGNDFLDGGAGNDTIFGGEGDDTIVFDPADTNVIDGGAGIDTLIDTSVGATINLNGIANLVDFEKIDVRDSDPTDIINLDLAGLTNIIGSDNSLDSILPDGRLKLVIDGDAGDQLMLGSNAIHGMASGSLAGGWGLGAMGTTEFDYFGTGTGYLKLTNGAIDLYVHEDLANVV